MKKFAKQTNRKLIVFSSSNSVMGFPVLMALNVQNTVVTNTASSKHYYFNYIEINCDV